MTALDPDSTFARVLAACCPDSAIDVREHAMAVTATALEARARPRNPSRNTTAAVRNPPEEHADGGRGGTV